MPLLRNYELVPVETFTPRTGTAATAAVTTTKSFVELRRPLEKAYLMLNVISGGAGGGVGTGSSFTVKVQGAPIQSASWATVMRCWTAGAPAAGAGAGNTVFAAATTAGMQKIIFPVLQPWLRVVTTYRGETRNVKWGCYLSGIEDD